MKLYTLLAVLMFQALPASAQVNTIDSQGRLITSPVVEEHLQDNKIYFFAHSMCANCQDAYIFLNKYHKDLNIPITDMKFHHNFELYKECVQKFNIPNEDLRLPLICMGNHYIMGWKASDSLLFNEYLKKMPEKQ